MWAGLCGDCIAVELRRGTDSIGARELRGVYFDNHRTACDRVGLWAANAAGFGVHRWSYGHFNHWPVFWWVKLPHQTNKQQINKHITTIKNYMNQTFHMVFGAGFGYYIWNNLNLNYWKFYLNHVNFHLKFYLTHDVTFFTKANHINNWNGWGVDFAFFFNTFLFLIFNTRPILGTRLNRKQSLKRRPLWSIYCATFTCHKVVENPKIWNVLLKFGKLESWTSELFI